MKDETQKAYTYRKQEAPEVGAEYVRWQMAESAFYCLGFIIAAAGIAYFAKRLLRSEEYEFSVFPILAAAFCAFTALTHAAHFTKCIVAPRIVLIEGIKEIVK